MIHKLPHELPPPLPALDSAACTHRYARLVAEPHFRRLSDPSPGQPAVYPFDEHVHWCPECGSLSVAHRPGERKWRAPQESTGYPIATAGGGQ